MLTDHRGDNAEPFAEPLQKTTRPEPNGGGREILEQIEYAVKK